MTSGKRTYTTGITLNQYGATRTAAALTRAGKRSVPTGGTNKTLGTGT